MAFEKIIQFDTIADFFQDKGLKPIKMLGSGMFGCAWLIRPTMKNTFNFAQAVLKITADVTEYIGASRIHANQGWEKTSNVPIVYAYGRINTNDWVEFALTHDITLGWEMYKPETGLFYYIREPLESIPDKLMTKTNYRAITIDAVKQIRKKLRLLAVDNAYNNWGMRPKELKKYQLDTKQPFPEIVLRDLSLLLDKQKVNA